MGRYPFSLFSPINNNRYKSIVNNILLNLISQNLGNKWGILRLLVLLHTMHFYVVLILELSHLAPMVEGEPHQLISETIVNDGLSLFVVGSLP